MKLLNSFIFSNSAWVRFLRHFLFWTADLINYFLVLSINTEITEIVIYRILFRMPVVIVTTYFILYFIIPKFARPANRLSLLLLVVGTFVLFGITVRFYGYYILDPMIDPNQQINFNIWDFRRVLAEVLQYMVVISMAIAIKLIKNKTELQLKNQELMNQKRTAELSFLKAQMHPHFLFNTLNTLYSDVIQEKGKSEQIILQLSDVLRFILQECNRPLIAISQEIKVIRNYLDLEKLRHGNRLDFDLLLEIEDNSKLISPLLLLPFIENSCKHTLASIRGNILISINIKTEGEYLIFYVKNDVSEDTANNCANHGMGIDNVKKQLKLLYGSDYILNLKKGDSRFSVYLKMPISYEQN